MTDVFIRTRHTNYEGGMLRAEMRQVSAQRWRMEPGVRVRFLWNMSALQGRLEAEKEAESDPYILTDDDVLIVGRNWVERACSILLRNTVYGAASTLSLIESENQATGEGEIYPMHAIGQPMVIRKGLMADLPEMTLQGECQVIQAHLESKGLKEGILDCRRVQGLRHIHMGHGFSSNPDLHWGV